MAVFVAMAAFGHAIAAGGQPVEIVSWASNAPEWNRRLGVTMLRRGCSSAPAACLGQIRQAAAQQNVERWTIAVKGDRRTMLAYAVEYSRLSLSEVRLVQVDIDDFVALMKRWNLETIGSAGEAFAEFARNVKSANPDLGLGITLYEDELDSRVLQGLSAAARAEVDRVSLYLHYRANAGGFPRYVDRVKELFPRAAIWAGSYAYDRTDYLPCAQGDRQPCSSVEEESHFRASLEIQLDLLRSGKVAGIEFYPGAFGLEEHWHGWDKPRICQAERRDACIELTRRMRQFVCDSLEKCRGS
jgi:hypothetical protein